MPASTPVSAGQKFERLTIVRHDHIKKYKSSNHNYYLCRCDCGVSRVVSIVHLRAGKTKSCGCLNREDTVLRETTHGHTGKAHRKGTRTYKAWQNMLKRCNNPNYFQFHLYGGRGIGVCERWTEFANFLADIGEIEPPLSLDRIDVNGDYCPENCRTATAKEQARNRRSNLLVTCRGETKTLVEWCEVAGTNYHRAYRRIRLGWSPEEVFSDA